MNIELKNVKHAAFASEETECFSATIYIDGKKAGEVSNDGHGGPDSFHPWALQTKIDAYAKTLPKADISHFYNDGEKHEMEQSAEMLIGEILNKYLETRQLKRMCANKVLFRKPNETYADGAYHTLKSKFSPAAKQHLVGKYGASVFILNETL